MQSYTPPIEHEPPEQRCERVDIDIPKRNEIFDCQPAKVTMHFPGFTWSFNFYENEINFTADELKGLTKQEAIDLQRKKDIAYLQS